MQISEDVHNYMEVLLGNLLSDLGYTEKYSAEQLADLACLALNQLRPIYIRHDIDFLAALAENKLVALKQQVATALEAAESMIIDDRRVDRDDELPTLYIDSRYLDEDPELEWYETPLLPTSKRLN
ncbi:late competence development ComFB family protein [Vibrio sp. Of7-15]|uniref:late competence development ComFB family protein n=1 Tax=Vibrio sp. Of7-15 TaxID=2724879 RepID=UPI001EF29890|nr:late competence development ComFB family protein [Vibrio sp. Of7-15]MCG7496468.1 late competence development ComFB family protein [Vibrio sp. Of7-15]